MQSFAKDNAGFKYLLTVLDTFSKYGWIVPLKDKTGKSTADGFAKILASSGRKAGKIWVDEDKEFYNKDVKKLVELYSTEKEEKSCVVERWNRSIRDQMFKYFSANSTRKYIDVLDALVDQYNNKVVARAHEIVSGEHDLVSRAHDIKYFYYMSILRSP